MQDSAASTSRSAISMSWAQVPASSFARSASAIVLASYCNGLLSRILAGDVLFLADATLLYQQLGAGPKHLCSRLTGGCSGRDPARAGGRSSGLVPALSFRSLALTVANVVDRLRSSASAHDLQFETAVGQHIRFGQETTCDLRYDSPRAESQWQSAHSQLTSPKPEMYCHLVLVNGGGFGGGRQLLFRGQMSQRSNTKPKSNGRCKWDSEFDQHTFNLLRCSL